MRILYDYAMQFVGIPYRWGGDDPIDGYDCSGLVQDILYSAGEDPPYDQTAQGLYDWFSEKGRARFNTWGLGSLAFFGSSAKKITHIAFCLDEYRMLEAGRGGRRTKTKQDAVDQNAFVMVSLIRRRGDLVNMLKPHYAKIGYTGR